MARNARLSVVMLIALAALALAAKPAAEPIELPIDFTKQLDQFDAQSPDHWRVEKQGDHHTLVLHTVGKSPQKPRRPADYQLLKDHHWRTLTLNCQMKLNSDDHGADVVVVFGYIDDRHFYYAHLSNDADGKVHNIIMAVEGDSRRTIQTPQKPEVRMSRDWHNVRLTHDATGNVAVFIDDLKKPLMTAKIDDFKPGRAGIGAFNDPAMFRDLRFIGTTMDALKER